MFHLFYGLYKQCTQKDEYFILILGLDNAGKTTLLEQAKAQFNSSYVGLNPKKITATVGLNIGRIDTAGIRLNFWDLGGQEELQSLWDKYYSECHAIIYVVDSGDRNRLNETKDAFATMIHNQHLDGVPLLLLANKQDIEASMLVAEVKSQLSSVGTPYIGRRECLALGCSALTGAGVSDGISWVVEQIKLNPIRPARTQI
ncbi:ADP-ribosylation factor-related protein 1-like [Paramacrobiotus metropolitanus]|uniref:ADP-ribosylation factor-related protein 1-like n=1 Tax=Paramacrobiotus metropolitanus TaxID=2943436 RepID=UPI002445FE08|nr:ADP-ribosylation factor-related protein 1-like [Paramacrobiotus metropolitanus]